MHLERTPGVLGNGPAEQGKLKELTVVQLREQQEGWREGYRSGLDLGPDQVLGALTIVIAKVG